MKDSKLWSSEVDNMTVIEEFVDKVQSDALRSAIRIADTFALNHKLSAPEIIIAIQIRDAIERLVKEIEE